jgi:Bacterial pre-peptidase C-terminal domain
MRFASIVVLAAALALAACTEGNGDTGSLAVNFIWAPDAPAAASAAAADAPTSQPLVQIPSDVVELQLRLLTTATSLYDSGNVVIGVAEGSYTFDNVPTSTGYTLWIDTLRGDGSSTCSLAVLNLIVATGETTSVDADLSSCTPALGGATVTWGEGALVAGALAVSGSVLYHFSLYYTFDGTASTAYTLTLTPSAGNPDLYLYSSSVPEAASRLDFSAQTGTAVDTVSYTATATQTYYVEVRGSDSANPDTPSTFTLGLN